MGFIVGFMFASSMSRRTQTAATSQTMPADHPNVGGQRQAGGNPEAARAMVTADIEKARKEPKNSHELSLHAGASPHADIIPHGTFLSRL